MWKHVPLGDVSCFELYNGAFVCVCSLLSQAITDPYISYHFIMPPFLLSRSVWNECITTDLTVSESISLYYLYLPDINTVNSPWFFSTMQLWNAMNPRWKHDPGFLHMRCPAWMMTLVVNSPWIFEAQTQTSTQTNRSIKKPRKSQAILLFLSMACICPPFLAAARQQWSPLGKRRWWPVHILSQAGHFLWLGVHMGEVFCQNPDSSYLYNFIYIP